MSDQTAFAEIKVVPPAAQFRWSRGSLTIDSGITGESDNVLRDARPSTPCAACFDKPSPVAAPNSDHYAVPLSGGRDSRHILLELADQGFRNPICVTAKVMVASIDEDVVAAAQLTAALGLRHAVVDPPMPIVGAEAQEEHPDALLCR